MSEPKTYTGGCHCGAVRFEADIDLGTTVNRCNCSMCTKASLSNLIIKPGAFRLVAGQDQLADYQRGGATTHFPFCKVCGIHSFGHGNIPEVGGDYVAINVNCLDDVDPARLKYHYWDGRHNNWDAGTRSQPWPMA